MFLKAKSIRLKKTRSRLISLLNDKARLVGRNKLTLEVILYWRLVALLGGDSSCMRVCQDALVCQNVEQAFRLGTWAVIQNPKKNSNAFWAMSLWVANDGHLGIVEECWQKLAKKAKTKKIARGKLLCLWRLFALFSVDRVKDTWEYLDAGVSAANALHGLRFLYEFGVSPEELFPYYNRYLIQAKGKTLTSLSADFASLRGSLNDDSEASVEALISNLGDNIYAAAKKSLYLSDYLASRPHASVTQTSRLSEAVFVLHALSSGTQRLWEMLSDRQKTIAIVGNSECEIGRGNGEKIDRSDIVIRFNRFSADDRFAGDYGRKTTIVVSNVAALPKVKLQPDVQGILLTAPDYQVFPSHVSTVAQWCKLGVPVAVIPRDLVTDLSKKLGASPSSGLRTIKATIFARGSVEGISCYGFCGIDQVGNTPKPANYGRQSKPSFRHNWHGEAVLLPALLSGRSIKTAPEDMSELRKRNTWGSLKTFKPLKIRFLGDHSKYHCGSKAVADFIRVKLTKIGAIVENDDFDVLVVNGEGSMHHDSSAYHDKMRALKNALDTGRRALLVNTVWQDNGHEYDDVLHRLEEIVVRESLSQEQLMSKHGISSTLIPDFSYFYSLSKVSEKVDYKGAVVVTDIYSDTYGGFVRATGGRLAKLPYVEMKKRDWSSLVTSLKTASLLITGRHHAVYAACKAEIPFIAFGGNTHKIQGLFVSAGVGIPICNNLSEAEAALEWAMVNKGEYERLFNWLRDQSEWRPQFL